MVGVFYVVSGNGTLELLPPATVGSVHLRRGLRETDPLLP